jgi:hypothetical protein
MSEITGPQNVAHNNVAGYTVLPQDSVSYTWTATGGIVVFGQGLGAVVVQWTTAGTNNLSVQLTTAQGALVDISIPVDTSAQGGHPPIEE